MAFKKIDKEFQYTDDSVNCYGFRLLTSGYDLEAFQRNPIGFYMHGEVKDCPRDLGVLVKWDDFRKEGDKVFAKPIINLSHPRGQQTVEEIEDGFLNGASVGKIIAIEISDDPELMVPGQTGPTVTKWYNKELSLVDIPGNNNSLSLFDKDGNAINLANYKNQSNMKQIFLTADMLKAMNLADNSDQTAINAAFQSLVAKASQADALKGQLDVALSDKTTAETALSTFKKATNEKVINDLLDKALNQDKKITVALKAKLEKQYENRPDELKELLADMQPFQSIVEQIVPGTLGVGDQYKNLSFEEMDKKGLLPGLKAANIELFKQKFKQTYGVDYKG